MKRCPKNINTSQEQMGAKAFDLGPIRNDYRDYLHFRKIVESASLRVPFGFITKPSDLASFLTENVKIVKIFGPMSKFEGLSKRNGLCWVVWWHLEHWLPNM